MKRLKTFLLYALAIAAFWFLSDFLIYMAINGTYQHIDAQVLSESPVINVPDSKATYVNGYVKGNIYNNTGTTISKKYIKLDLYSPRDVNLGTKYIEIENLENGQTKDFEMWFKYTDVEYCKISIVDDTNGATEEQFMSDETKFYLIIGTLAVLYFI